MARQAPLTDEEAVVAYLSCSGEQRDVLAKHLVQSSDARELLCMAQQALDAVQPQISPRVPRQPVNKLKRTPNERIPKNV